MFSGVSADDVPSLQRRDNSVNSLAELKRVVYSLMCHIFFSHTFYLYYMPVLGVGAYRLEPFGFGVSAVYRCWSLHVGAVWLWGQCCL